MAGTDEYAPTFALIDTDQDGFISAGEFKKLLDVLGGGSVPDETAAAMFAQMDGDGDGKVDLVVTFLVTTRLAMPVILVALAVVALLGGSLTVVILTLGLLKWDRFAVVMRSATQQTRSLDYVAAAQAAGASTARVILGEVLPNIAPHLIVVATLEAASAILLEAALSFLGLGVQPPLPSWGLMIAEAKAYMFFSFWLIAIPGTALAVLVFGINLAGDGLRDALAPEGRT